MDNLTNKKIKEAMAQIKYVKKGFLGLYYYWTKPLEAHQSLRKAEKLKISDGLLKIDEKDIKLTFRGYQGIYNDSAIDVLRQIPNIYFDMIKMGNVYAYSLKVKKISELDECVDARVTLFKALDVPKDIINQEVLFNDNFPFGENE